MTVIGRAALAVLVAGISVTATISAQAVTTQAVTTQAVTAQAAVAVAGAPSSVGTVAISAITGNQLGCMPPEAGAIEPDGRLNHVFLNGANPTGPFYRDYVSTEQGVTALGPTTYAFIGSTNTGFPRRVSSMPNTFTGGSGAASGTFTCSTNAACTMDQSTP